MSTSTTLILAAIAKIQKDYPHKSFGDIIVSLLEYVDDNGAADQLDWLAHTGNHSVLESLKEYKEWGALKQRMDGYYVEPRVPSFYDGPKLCPSCSQPEGHPHRPRCPWDKK